MSSIGKNSNSHYPNAYYPTIMHYQNVDSWIFMEESDETVLTNNTTNSCLDEHEIGEIDEALFSTTFFDGAKSDDLDASEIDLALLGKDINSENKFTLKTDLHFPHTTVDKNIAHILFDDNVNDNKFLNTHLHQPYDDNTNFTFAEKTKKGECFGKNENAIIDKHNVHHHQQYALTGNSDVSDVTNFSKQLSHQTTHSNDYYDNNINSDNKSCCLNTAKNGVVPLNNTNLDTSNVSIYTSTTSPMDLIGTSNNSSQQHLNTADCYTTNDLLRESPSIKTLSFDLLKYGKNSDNTDDKIFKTSNKITLDAKKNGRVSGHFLPFMTDTTCLEKSAPVDDALQNFGQKKGNNYNNGEIIKNENYYCGEEITTDNNYNGISSHSSLPNHFVPKLHLPLETNDINNYTNNVLPSLAQTLTSSICFNIASFLPSSICQSTITDLTRDINNCNKTITPLQNNNYKPFLPPIENTSLITTNVSRNIPVQTLEPLTIISKIHEKIKPFEHCDSTYFIPVTSSCNNKRPFHQNDFPIANSTRIQLSSAVNHNNNDIVCAPHYVSINNNNPVQGKTQQCAKFGDNFINTATLNDIFDEPPNLLPSANIEGHDVTLSKHNQHASISNVSISDTLIDPFEDIILGEDALTASEDFLPTTANTLSFVDTDEPTTALDLIDNLLFDIDLDEFHTGKLIDFIPIKSSNKTSPEETNSKISPLPTMNIVPNDINCSSALYKKREYNCEDIDFGTSLPAKIKKESYHSSVSKNSFDNTSQPSNLSHSLYKMAPNGLTRTYDGKSNDPLLSEWFKINAISLPTTHQNNLNSYFSEMLSAMQKPLLENEINEYLSTYYNGNPDTFSKTNAPNTTNIISDAFLTDYMINGAMSLPTCMENVISSQKIQCSNQSLPKNQPYEVNKKRCGSIIFNNDSVENGSITPNTYLTSPYSYPISMIYQEQESNKEQQPSPSTFAASKPKQPALSVKSNTNASNNLSKLNLAVSNSLSHNMNNGAPNSLTPQTGAKGFVFNNFSLVNNMNFSQSYGHHNYVPTSSYKYGGSTYADSYGSTNFISSPLSYFSPSFEDPKNRKKLQNKLAAARYRQKKKEESLNLIVMERSLIEINQNLKNRVQCLTHEIEMLKQLLK